MSTLSALLKGFGNWHTIYTRMNRWAKTGVLDRLFEKLQLSVNTLYKERRRSCCSTRPPPLTTSNASVAVRPCMVYSNPL